MIPLDDSPLDLTIRVLGSAYVAAVAYQSARLAARDGRPVAGLIAAVLLAAPGLLLVARPAVGRWAGRTLWGLVQLVE